MIYIGIDPGQSGAIAAIMPSGDVETIQNDVTERDLSDWLEDVSSCETPELRAHAIIEQVHSMPKQGVASSFKFGMSYGFLRGLLVAHAIPFETVTPQKWQQVMRCRTKGDKNVTKAKAQELFPGYKWTHKTADAVLLAEYGRRMREGVNQ